MARFWESAHKYTPLPTSEKAPLPPSPLQSQHNRRPSSKSVGNALHLLNILLLLYRLSSFLTASKIGPCDTIDKGYTCSPSISQYWGQYSLWYRVPSEIDVTPPKGCEVTFANVLSRHGARDPTRLASDDYRRLIEKIQNTSTDYPGKFGFLKDYKYNLGSEELTDAGRQELINSGVHFFRRYSALVRSHVPFVRATDQHRVLESAEKWLEGFARESDPKAKVHVVTPTKPKVDVIIPEGSSNNPLSPSRCLSYDDDYDSGSKLLSEWRTIFVPPIQERVNAALHVALSTYDILRLLDMCPFDTVANPSANVSSFCGLFTESEWHQYDYYRTLGKFYGYGPGHRYGPTQGVGYVNELLARLTEKPVHDNTTTDPKLDSDPKTFPLDRKVYADFSHDNDMISILASLGLYNKTQMLPSTFIVGPENAYGFSAAWTVPFAARIYFEKLNCGWQEEFVRIIVNDRVQPLEFCGGDKYGRCTLSKFVESQSFARGGGLWEQCNSVEVPRDNEDSQRTSNERVKPLILQLQSLTKL